MAILQAGQVLGGCRVVRLIGEGGQADVYEAVTPAQERRALKVLAPSESPRRVAKEAEALASIEHVNVVRFYGAGVEGDRPYLVLELVEGDTLRDRLNEHGGFPPVEDLLRWLRQACEGLAEAHRLGIIHRDVKPENILITTSDVVKVIDFGFAKLTGLGTKSTQEGVSGTALYLPPEKLHSAEPSPAWDVYAMGATLYEALAGAHPLGPPSSNVMEVCQRHLSIRPKPLGEVAPDLPGDLAALVDQAIQSAPAQRPTMRALADGLHDALQRILAPRRAAARNAVPSREATLAPTLPLPVFAAIAPGASSSAPSESTSAGTKWGGTAVMAPTSPPVSSPVSSPGPTSAPGMVPRLGRGSALASTVPLDASVPVSPTYAGQGDRAALPPPATTWPPVTTRSAPEGVQSASTAKSAAAPLVAPRSRHEPLKATLDDPVDPRSCHAPLKATLDDPLVRRSSHSGHDVSAAPVEASARRTSAPSSRRGLAVALGGVLVVAAGAVGAWWMWRDPKAELSVGAPAPSSTPVVASAPATSTAPVASSATVTPSATAATPAALSAAAPGSRLSPTPPERRKADLRSKP